jgi:hypothetical protein
MSFDAKKAAHEAMNGDGDQDQTEVLEYIIKEELRKLTAREEAKLRYRTQAAGEKPPPQSTPLAELLAEPDDEPQYLIKDLWLTGGKILFSAQYKAGKTTMVGNLVRCLADGDTFLGTSDAGIDPWLYKNFTVRPLQPGQTIFIADLEMSRRTLRTWLREQGIRNKGRVRAESFRGRLDEFDLLDPARRTEWARALRSWAIKILVVDPIGPLLAHYGFAEGDNTDVGKVLAAVDALAADAGVEEVLLVHHMGHNGERSRGASVFRGWPDAEWRLLREEPPRGKEAPPDAARFFTAEGRDVAVHETKLDYDLATRHLSIAGGSRTQHAISKWEKPVLEAVKTWPGATTTALEEKWGDVPQTGGRRALKALVAAGKVHTYPGRQRAVHHVFGDDCDAPTTCLLAKKEAGLDE